MTSRTSASRSRRTGRTNPPQPAQRPGRLPPRAIIAAVVAAVLVALVAAFVAGGGNDGDGTDAGSGSRDAVAVDGEALPALPGAGDDPAVGATLPTLTGTDLAGAPMAIGPDGRPTMIVFLAHWCPHCQAEVPVVQDWVDGGGLPAGVDLVSVSTAVDDRRPNYPPAEWLEREGWTAPVLDDADGVAAEAAGLSAFPYFVFVDGDGTVVARTTGELTPAQLDSYASTLAATVP